MNFHFQGYFVLKRKQRLTGLKKLLPDQVHLEVMRGTLEHNARYIRKEGGPIEQFGSAQNGAGHTKVAEDIMLQIREGKSDLDIMAAIPSAFHAQRNMESFRFKWQAKQAQEWRNLEVRVYWGDTGVGKTKLARSMMPNCFMIHLSAPEWWDGYDGHTELLIDDYDSGISCVRLLNILDGHPCRLPVKGGFRWALWTKVFITSNSPPVEWHAKAKTVHHAAMMRRISSVHNLVAIEDEAQQ